MSKSLTEQKVLKKLDIVDFRHLTKDKVIAMASMLDKMDPEVAKKALEQFPNFSATTKEMLAGYKDTLDKGMDANKDSVQSYYNSCDSIIETLQRQLDNENLSFDERKCIIDKLSENKKFLATLTVIGATAVGVITVALASTLGGNTTVEMDDINKLT